MDSVDSLIKTSYGWLALGKSENQYVIVDVNLIKESSWNLLISIIAKRNKLTDQWYIHFYVYSLIINYFIKINDELSKKYRLDNKDTNRRYKKSIQ